MSANCAKVLNGTSFSKGGIFLFGLDQKIFIRNSSTFVEKSFSDRTLFLSKNIVIFRNLNHYQICKERKKKFQTFSHRTL